MAAADVSLQPPEPFQIQPDLLDALFHGDVHFFQRCRADQPIGFQSMSFLKPADRFFQSFIIIFAFRRFCGGQVACQEQPLSQQR